MMRNRIKPRVNFAAKKAQQNAPAIPKALSDMLKKAVSERIKADIDNGAFYRVRRKKPVD